MSHAGVDGLSMHYSTNDYRNHRGLVTAATHWGHTSDARAVLAVSSMRRYLRSNGHDLSDHVLIRVF